MKDIEDKSIDLVVIDPPYNIGIDKWDKIDKYRMETKNESKIN